MDTHKDMFGGYDMVAGSKSKSAAVAIVPLGLEGNNSWMSGSSKGPAAIIEASHELETFNVDFGIDVSQEGITTLWPEFTSTREEDVVASVDRIVKALIDTNTLPVLVGGSHMVCIGAFKAMSEKYNNLSILQLDAHADLRDSYLGSKYNHACVMARALDYTDSISQVGVRSMSKGEYMKAALNRIFLRKNMMNGYKAMLMDQLEDNVYLTIDLDVLDPSIMPSTGTPVPNGLLYNELIELIGEVSMKRKIVGFDIVELKPDPNNKAPDFLAAKLIYDIITMIFLGKL